MNPEQGLQDTDARDIAHKIGIPDDALDQATQLLQALYKAFWESDASLAEINPLIVTDDGQALAFIQRVVLSTRDLMSTKQPYHVTIAPGVDAAMMAAMCLALDDLVNGSSLRRSQSNASVP